MRPPRRSICLALLAVAAVGGAACDRAKLRETPTPSPPAVPQANTRQVQPSPTSAASAVPRDPNAPVRFTLLNGRVQYEVPAVWRNGGGDQLSVDESRPPVSDSRWHLFREPFPNRRLSDAQPLVMFPGQMPASVDAYLLEAPQSLRDFSRTHGIPYSSEDDAVIRQDTAEGGLRIRRADWRSESSFECFKVKGAVGVVFGFSYTRTPRPPRAWLAEVLDHAHGICASITIKDGRRTSTGGPK